MDDRTIERVRMGMNDPHTGPETIALMLTGACNLSCVYCRGGRIEDGRTESKGEELNTGELFGLFEDARGFRTKEINIGGMRGEPFCRKDISPIMRKIKSLGFTGSMTTNGSMLNGALAVDMSGYDWDILLLSLDAPFAGLQHSLRPAVNKQGYFQNIVEFLDTLEKISSKMRILVNMVITVHNFRHLPEMVKFVNNYKNIESLNILKLVDMGLPGYS
ncbi:MAG: radical SAM protein, partial [Candidatus Omnitrophota bacterium]